MKIFLMSLLCSSVLNAASLGPYEKKITVPENIKGVTTVNAEGLIELALKYHNLIIIDSRITDDRAMGYIENSRSLTDIDTDCESLKEVVSEYDDKVAFYCNGPACGRSAKATKVAVQCGYKNIYWFKGGFSEWKVKDYSYIVE